MSLPTFNKQESLRIIPLWINNEPTISMVLDRLMVEYSKEIVRQDSEWETLRQSIEFTAKKQALIDFKNILRNCQ